MIDNTSTSTNQNWFSIRYTATAPAGLPPVLQAERMERHTDDAGTWVVALWDRKDADGSVVSTCVLRVSADQICSVTQHRDMAGAASQFAPGSSTDEHSSDERIRS